MISSLITLLSESRLAKMIGVGILLIGIFSVQQVRLNNRGDKISDLTSQVHELRADVAILVSVNNKQALLVKETNEAIDQMKAKALQDSLTAIAQRDWAMRRFREFESKYEAVKDQLKGDSTLTWDDLFLP